MLVQGSTLHDAACIWITKYDGYTPPERFITRFKPVGRPFRPWPDRYTHQPITQVLGTVKISIIIYIGFHEYKGEGLLKDCAVIKPRIVSLTLDLSERNDVCSGVSI